MVIYSCWGFTYSKGWEWKKRKAKPSTAQRTPRPLRSKTKALLLSREELHLLCWRISWGIPLPVPQFNSPCQRVLEPRRKWASTVVLHQFLCLRTLSAGGERMRWCFLCFPSWPIETCVFRQPVSLQRESFLLQGIYCDCSTEHTHSGACWPSLVPSQELAYTSMHQLSTDFIHCLDLIVACYLLFLFVLPHMTQKSVFLYDSWCKILCVEMQAALIVVKSCIEFYIQHNVYLFFFSSEIQYAHLP